jgi:hypothetical protein
MEEAKAELLAELGAGKDEADKAKENERVVRSG